MRIVFPYLTEGTHSSFYTDFQDGLLLAARELGHEPVRIKFAECGTVSQDERENLYASLAAGCDAVLDICAWGCALSQVRVWDGSESGEPIFDSHEAPYVAMLYDQPWFQPLPAVQSLRSYAAVSDRYHPAQISLIYPQLALSGFAFAPPAARAENDRSLAWSKRDIEVLYVGNLQYDALEPPWRATASARLFDAVTDAALANPQLPLDRILLSATAELGFSIDAGMALDMLRPIEYFLRARYRHDAVLSLARAGVPLTLVGAGWDRLDLPRNVTLLPATDYEGFLAFAGRSKICLDASSYPGGLNDRVLNYAVNRSVCFSNADEELRETFGEDAGMQYYGMRALDALADQIRGMLACGRELQARGERSREIALAGQTWRHRLDTILSAIKAEDRLQS